MKLNQFYCLILVVLYSISTGVLKAETTEPQEYHSMEQMMASKLEKKQIELMVDKMAESGRITTEDAAKAKRELASYDDGDLNNLKNLAVSDIKTKRLLDH